MDKARVAAALICGCAVGASAVAQRVGDERAVPFHLDQQVLESGKVGNDDIIEFGRYLFTARFTSLDGAGRPGSTGSGLPTRRPTLNAKPLLRTSGPDSNSCASCHSEPAIGAAGNFVANVFVGAQEREPVLESVSGSFSAERRTSSMFGSGLLELAAREMTADMHQLRAEAVRQAKATGRQVTLPLLTKGVSFGSIGALPNGTVLTERIEGVDKDLVVRPWSQKGVVTSLRTFTVTAMNHHHGMQARERFGIRRTGSRDFDRDGVEDELVEGDITAVVAFQATLPVPIVIPPPSSERARAAERGRQVFADAGCVSCHLPALPLRASVFSEPGPYNLEGTLRASEVGKPLQFDLAQQPWAKNLKRNAQGQILVEAFTDMKRHRIADPETPQLANEVVSVGFAPTDEFVTKRLWEVGSSLGVYGHRGDITTIQGVIMAHGGEARASRRTFAALPSEDRAAVVEFLKTLQTPLDGVTQYPPNVLPPALWARLAPADAQGGTEVVAVIEGLEPILGRAKAAADRAEHTRDRIKSLAVRIAYERAKLASTTPASDDLKVLPAIPADIVVAIDRELDASSLAAHPGRAAIRDSLVRAGGALLASHAVAQQALRAASIASADEVVVSPVGYIPASAILANLERYRDTRDGAQIYKELTAWCEDVAFRVEQIGQQVAVATMRIEAYAASRPTPPERKTKVSLK